MDITRQIGGFGDNPEALMKAMTAGQISGRETTNLSLTGEPLKLESLERTVKLLEFRKKQIVLLNNFPKKLANSTVEEFVQLESYGEDRGGFYDEGELSDVEDSTYIRRAEFVKYIQVTGEVTVQAQMTKNLLDVYKNEVKNKTMWVMRKMNSALTKADSSIIPQEFNGIYKQHASIGSDFIYSNLEEYYNSNVVIDMRGEPLTQADIVDASDIIYENNGDVDSLFGSPSVISGLAKDYFSQQRIMMQTSNTGFRGGIGTVPKAIDTQWGDVSLMADKFLATDPPLTTADSASSPKAPNAPQAVQSDPVALESDGQSKFTSDDAGDVFYAVAALNKYGRSPLTVLDSTKVTLAEGSSVDLGFTGGGGQTPPTGFEIYRSKPTSATDPSGIQFFPLFKVSKKELDNGYDGGESGVVRDRGRIMPGTEQAFTTAMNEEVLCYKQLAPIFKLDLSVQSMSRRFIIANFGTPQLYAPRKMVKFINIGRYKA